MRSIFFAIFAPDASIPKFFLAVPATLPAAAHPAFDGRIKGKFGEPEGAEVEPIGAFAVKFAHCYKAS
jgi:hypothetical protein